MRRNRYAYDEMTDAREPLGRRLGRFVGLMGALFVVAMAVIVTQRLSHDSLALLVGLSCGVLAMVPTMALGFLIWRRESRRQTREQSRPTQVPPTPPVIVISPQALSGYGDSPRTWPPTSQWEPQEQQRTFKIVGEEE